MTFSQIEYFLEVAKTMNFHQAAENKFVTQQVMSRQIQALEAELDLQLFDRSNKRKLRLTPAGEILYAGWNKSVDEILHCLERAKDANKKQENKVVLGIHAISWIVDCAIEIIQNYKINHPDRVIETVVSGTVTLEEKLEKGSINLLLTFGSELLSELNSSCKVSNVEMSPAIILAKTHPLANKRNIEIPDLADETIYLLSNRFSKDASQRVLNDFAAHNISPKAIEYFDDAESMETKLMMGEGVNIGWDVLFRNRNRLKMYPIRSSTPVINDLVLCWTDEKYEIIARELAAVNIL